MPSIKDTIERPSEIETLMENFKKEPQGFDNFKPKSKSINKHKRILLLTLSI